MLNRECRIVIAIAIGAMLIAWVSEARADAKAKLTLYPSVSAVAPGMTFQVALHFELEKEWHLYWKDPGAAGLPPKIKWTLPEGFTAEQLRFPVPTRHIGPGTAVTNVLEGTPIMIVTMEAPSKLETPSVTIKGSAFWLVCKSLCLRETQDVELTLPVVQSESQVQSANTAVFDFARSALPRTQSEHVTLTPTVEDSVTRGQEFDVYLQVGIKDGMRLTGIDSKHPDQSIELFVAPSPGITFGEPAMPPTENTNDQSGYAGRVFIQIPAEVDKEATDADVPISGVLVYQVVDAKTGNPIGVEALEWETATSLR